MYPKIPNCNGKSKDTGHRIPSPRVENYAIQPAALNFNALKYRHKKERCRGRGGGLMRMISGTCMILRVKYHSRSHQMVLLSICVILRGKYRTTSQQRIFLLDLQTILFSQLLLPPEIRDVFRVGESESFDNVAFPWKEELVKDTTCASLNSPWEDTGRQRALENSHLAAEDSAVDGLRESHDQDHPSSGQFRPPEPPFTPHWRHSPGLHHLGSMPQISFGLFRGWLQSRDSERVGKSVVRRKRSAPAQMLLAWKTCATTLSCAQGARRRFLTRFWFRRHV